MSTEHLLGDIGAVLTAFIASEDHPRREAEAHLQRLAVEQPAEVLLVLAQVGAQGVGGFQLDHRLLALILLKRMAFKPLEGLFLNPQSQKPAAPFDVVRETTRGRIETVICAGIKDEMDVRMRKGLGACAANWAHECSIRHRPLLPLPPVLLELTASPHPFHRFTPFQLLDLTPTLLVDSVRDPIPAEQLAQMLQAGLNDPSVDVRVEAMKAVRSVLMEGVTGSERSEIGANLVLHSFETLRNLPPALVSHALIPLVDLASAHPGLFTTSLNPILSSLLPLLAPPAQETNLPPYQFSPYPPHNMTFDEWEDISNPATEIILSLMELRPSHMSEWENGRAVKEMIGLLLARQVATFGNDSQEWIETKDLDEEADEYPVLAEESLSRLSMALGGELVLPTLSQQVQALLQQEDWRCRFAAISGISSIAEGCLDELQTGLREVLAMLSSAAKDPHPRVRYEFLQCLGQLSADLEGALQENFADDVLQISLALLEDPIMRVRSHSAASLTNFFQEASPRHFEKYLEPVVCGLLNLYQSQVLYAQDQALATLATVATAAEKMFTPFYRNIMDLCFMILSNPAITDVAQRKLQGRAMECGTLLGMAVGKNMFGTDAVRLSQLMITIQNQIVDADDPRSGYLMDAWSNVCQSLGAAFEPFLQYVVPNLLKTASYKPSASLGETGDEHEDDTGGAHTYEIDQKIMAFESLTTYAFQMRGKFAPWLAPCMQLSLNELSCSFSEDVREAAAFLVPGLLQVAKDSKVWMDEPYNLTQVFQQLVNVIVKTNDIGYTALLYKSFTDSLHVISAPFPVELTTQLLKSGHAVLHTIAQTRADREAQEPYMDESDKEIYLEEQNEEEACLTQLRKALEMVIKVGDSNVGTEQGALANGLREELQGALDMVKEIKKRGMKGDGEKRFG
ncbi:karyopherin/importin that interacts with the nuclear pore complex [Cryptococcus neoformans C23]|uniref:Karyopherin/importin that interacts with the nuclear pore complex n=1 Tax=Cryptococcus neoformans (strain H99 / ATCC 208821 / CBS 10515 / FGSC 9487) TaxID=235443 RepID=J9VMB4_CRYN9|nr:karyopherin/importin that interacts with the nuclear pore complex [Cryptococcus neoformans var. grubii H99]AUB25446.1 karyopherin/importin that interacts with the nuclear pore complex [Cryptococcus neoformans var. grubii]OWZ43126.1 karyopherin/importin that interacts with the nuclear pore complex [Cryptococcus neoformans var. grubii C23]OXC84275.1 karyopherin/importin that interacts with the nuclear pore complex [Cryptococcus neoformans var. grubii AD1-7a]AFR95617.1 karyopherin/importin that|eukprot:XP_012050010.1 karyopherin/importin that interacts with the nuclear pore complex [Cryptococcus neoformans var. grubii H99]